MTPSELYTHIRGQCAESSADFWSLAEIYRLMSMGQQQIVNICGANQKTTTFSTVSGTKEYSRPAGVQIIEQVLYDSLQLVKIDRKQLVDIEGDAYGGVTVDGPAEYYYEYAGKIGFSPTPDEAKTVKLFYQGTPTDLTVASTTFDISQEYVPYLTDFCLYYMFLKDQASANIAMIYKQAWIDNLALIEFNECKRKSKNNNNSPIVTDSIFVD